MNIKSRIKKLEKVTNAGGYCLCFGLLKYEAVFNRNAPGMVERALDIRPTCGRAINIVSRNFLRAVSKECSRKTAAGGGFGIIREFMTFKERIHLEAQAAMARKKAAEEKEKMEIKTEDQEKEKQEPDRTGRVLP